MQHTYRHLPNLNHYPKWMLEYLLPIDFRSRCNLVEYEKALLRIRESSRVDPVCNVLFENTMGMIRLRHHVTELCIKHEDEIESLEKRVANLNKKIARLEKRLKPKVKSS